MWGGTPGLASRVAAAHWAPVRRLSVLWAQSLATSGWAGAACSATHRIGAAGWLMERAWRACWSRIVGAAGGVFIAVAGVPAGGGGGCLGPATAVCAGLFGRSALGPA